MQNPTNVAIKPKPIAKIGVVFLPSSIISASNIASPTAWKLCFSQIFLKNLKMNVINFHLQKPVCVIMCYNAFNKSSNKVTGLKGRTILEYGAQEWVYGSKLIDRKTILNWFVLKTLDDSCRLPPSN